MTEAERRLWRVLRLRQVGTTKFRRQMPIGRYFVDFISFEAKLIIEVNGGQHAENTKQDAKRTAFLEGEGFRVMRFWNNEVLENIEGVLQRIDEALMSGSPSP